MAHGEFLEPTYAATKLVKPTLINDAYFDASREINANICPGNDANILMGTFLHYSMSNVQINIQHQYNNQQNK